MSYKTVCVAGGGVLGSQIAFQAAYCGFDVTIWLRSEGSIGRTQPKIDHVREEYIAAIEGMADGTGEWCAGIADSGQPFDKEAALAAVERAYSTLKLELDLAKAVADADLVIESMAEDTQAKIDFYKKLAPVLPQKTVVVTNSSTLLPSTFAKYTGRPEKYLSLHFANSIWKNNMTEVMALERIPADIRANFVNRQALLRRACRLCQRYSHACPARQQGKERLSAQFHAGAMAAFGP